MMSEVLRKCVVLSVSIAIGMGAGVRNLDTPVVLKQQDFENGAYVISQPGTYVLGEDIVFRPKGELLAESPETWMFPNVSQAPYNTPGFRLGNFAALVVAADNVEVDLNGKTISQSPEHALLQRFFSVIELSNSPFPPKAGPAAFGDSSTFKTATNVLIHNGRIGLSAHHGIHGNLNNRVTLKNLEIGDFEVAGVALNACDNLVIENVHVSKTRSDTPANGRLSAAIFLLQALNARTKRSSVVDNTGFVTQMDELRRQLYAFIANDQDTNGLFGHVANGNPDASLVVGIMLHAKFSVANFADVRPADPSADITLKNVTVKALKVSPGEIGALKGTHVVNDMVGALFDVDFATDDSNRYKPNALADLQLAVAKFAQTCLEDAAGCGSIPMNVELFKRNTIGPKVVSWAESGESIDKLLVNANGTTEYSVVGNHDIMFHHTKGAIGLKLDGVQNVKAEGVVIESVENHAENSRRSKLALAYGGSYFYEGYMSRGISIAASVKVDLRGISVVNTTSTSSMPITTDVMRNCQEISVIGVSTDASFKATTGSGPEVLPPTHSSNDELTVSIPAAVGIVVGCVVGGGLLVAIVGYMKNRRQASSTLSIKDSGPFDQPNN